MPEISRFNLKKPINFDKNNHEFDIFSNLDPAKYNKSEIKQFKNVRISNNSVLFRYPKEIIPDTCISTENYKNYKSNYKFFLKYIFPKFNFHKNKRFLLITDDWTANYYL